MRKLISNTKEAKEWMKKNPERILYSYKEKINLVCMGPARVQAPLSIEGFKVLTGVKTDGTPIWKPLTEFEIEIN